MPTETAAAAVTGAPVLALSPWLVPNNFLFNCGTCEGLLSKMPTAYGVVAVQNNASGNGDFARLLIALKKLARAERRGLLVLEIHNPRLGPHLARKHGFTLVGGGRHAFLAVAGPGKVPAEFARVRKANPLDALLNKLVTRLPAALAAVVALSLALAACTAARPAEEAAAPQGPGHLHQALRAEPRWSRVR